MGRKLKRANVPMIMLPKTGGWDLVILGVEPFVVHDPPATKELDKKGFDPGGWFDITKVTAGTAYDKTIDGIRYIGRLVPDGATCLQVKTAILAQIADQATATT